MISCDPAHRAVHYPTDRRFRTAIAMSPAVVNCFPWCARIFGGRLSAGRRLPQIFGALLRVRVENQLETRAALGSCGGPRRENEPYGTLTRCGVLPESGPGV